MRRQQRGKNKIRIKLIFSGILLTVTGTVLFGVTYLSKGDKQNKINSTQQSTAKQVNSRTGRLDAKDDKSQAKNDIKNQEEIDDEQVVIQKATIYLDKEKTNSREEQIPKGATIKVKIIPGNDELLEIVTEHNKGFIEKKFLESRKKVQLNRASLKNANLNSKEVTNLLAQRIQSFVNTNGGDLSIYVESVDQEIEYGYQEDSVRRTASSIKLAFITYLMDLASNGNLDLSEKLVYQENDYYGGTGIIQHETFGSEYSIERLAELVIRYSDNIAYLMLLNRLGEQNFVSFLKKLDNTSQNDRFFSTAKILTNYMKYVNNQKDSNKYIHKLYEWLHQSTFDDGVAIGVPAVDVAHKTGWMPMYAVSNDIALVESDRPYYVTIMTNGYSEEYSEQAISDLAAIIDECMLQLA